MSELELDQSPEVAEETPEVEAEKPAKAVKSKPAKADVRYFETSMDGLRLLVADGNEPGYSDPSLLEFVRAQRYTKMFRGDRVRFGLFVVEADAPARVLELLVADHNVTELTPEQYEALVGDPETRKVV